ncbi:methylated-DNA--[protein]-cysteine S-methyltransferase [Pseudoalteromonas sp. MMG010]|uniref:methylated-DNA--[protein]-cysteine S-methyltransferase n=1 Tax=Pseudoalteromonas sp. MMG010 TaxID=2822685 RepID=UPI001B3A6726|nr:methylated-DNA--[protein]-cysteine S-methyltransferase [Pseudoalteromonas sp. MMG010]MBQ4833745.1 methylated-DNA--[protein]-cysteine S-methyltransferase [Pseudoalteromonas sp. MMG010]
MIIQTKIASPIGDIVIQASENGVTYVGFYPTIITTEIALASTKNEHIINCAQQLNEYFDHQRREFNVVLDVQGTEFQQRVWQTLSQLPYGTTQSYSYIAQQLNNPKAVRAVGAANGKNPISIIVPCHRIIGMNKTLTGYAGGLDRKKWLLRHEGMTL